MPKGKIALTIAGSDPRGDAGVQADLKVFRDFGLKGFCVVTALTVQDAHEFRELNPLPPEAIRHQWRHLTPFPVAGIKIGMLATAANVQVVVDFLKGRPAGPVVLDPVFRSSTGAALIDERGKLLVQEELLPLVDVVTPNLDEASFFVSSPVTDLETMKKAAPMIWRAMDDGRKKKKAVVIKGGHLKGDPIDVVFDGQRIRLIRGKRVIGGPFRGTGCRFSSALAASLALGQKFFEAAERAKTYLTQDLMTQSA